MAVFFDVFVPIKPGIDEISPGMFAAATDANGAALVASGSVADKVAAKQIKVRDVVFINYDLDGTPTAGSFIVTATGGGSLAGYTIPAGYLQAENNLSDVASVSGAQLNLGIIYAKTTQVLFSDLATAGTKTIQASSGTQRYKMRGIILSGAGTNFSGGGGDRNIAIQSLDGTVVYSVMTAAKVQSLAATRWGDTGVPFPASAADLDTASPVGDGIVAKYSGGAADYSAGSLSVITFLERVQ